MITTNAGDFFALVPPVPTFSQGDADGVLAQAEREIAQCEVSEVQWWERSAPFILRWLPDPPPDGMQVDQIFQVEVSGLAATEAVELQTSGGQSLATAVPARTGVAMLSFLASGGGAAAAPPVLTRIELPATGLAASTVDLGANNRLTLNPSSRKLASARAVSVFYMEVVPGALLNRNEAIRVSRSAVGMGLSSWQL